jgi:hypothetical protein
MRVSGIEDCGSSPKNLLLAEFFVALFGVDGGAMMAGHKCFEFCGVFDFVNLKATHIARATLWCTESRSSQNTQGERA